MNASTPNIAALDAGPVQRWNAALAGGAVATAWVLASPAFAAGLALGAFFEAVNFRTLRRNAEVAFTHASSGSALVAAGFGLRFSLLLLAVGGSLYAGVHPIGLVIGLSLIVPSSLISAWLARPPITETVALDSEEANWDQWNPWFARENISEDEDSP